MVSAAGFSIRVTRRALSRRVVPARRPTRGSGLGGVVDVFRAGEGALPA
jgi:hypothetical protein